MKRQFIYRDLGEFGFNQFYELKNNTWTWVDLEIDCDEMTLENFRREDNLNVQFWLHEDKTRLGIASNFLGHKRQASIPTSMLTSYQLTFTKPAKGGAEFDLSIDSQIYSGVLIQGEINVAYRGNSNWDINDYEKKKEILERIANSVMQLTGGQITKRIEYINA